MQVTAWLELKRGPSGASAVCAGSGLREAPTSPQQSEAEPGVRGRAGGQGKRWRGEGRRAPARPNSPLAAGTARLRPLFATLENGLGAPANAGICPGQVTLQILGLGEWRSCRHGSGEGGETARRRGQNAERTAVGRWGQNRKWRRAFETAKTDLEEHSQAYRQSACARACSTILGRCNHISSVCRIIY